MKCHMRCLDLKRAMYMTISFSYREIKTTKINISFKKRDLQKHCVEQKLCHTRFWIEDF